MVRIATTKKKGKKEMTKERYVSRRDTNGAGLFVCCAIRGIRGITINIRDKGVGLLRRLHAQG